MDPVAPLDAECLPVVTALGYKTEYVPRGFEIPSKEVQERVRAEHGTLIEFIASFGASSAQTSGSQTGDGWAREPGSGPGEDPAILFLDSAASAIRPSHEEEYAV